MRPEDSRNTGPIVPQRQLLGTINDGSRHVNHEAAANVVRGQIDRIYDTQHVAESTSQPTSEEIQQQSIEDENPYDRTHSTDEQIQQDQWKQYHSAWQDYYQKYYERYYVGQVYQAKRELEERVAHEKLSGAPAQSINNSAEQGAMQARETFSRDEAMYDLRAKLLGKVQEHATKVRKSRHFIPISAAACVVLLFLFLQYNRVLIANVQAYVSPGNIDPANIIIDPTTNLAVDAAPKLIIPKINVDVPVEYNVTPDYKSQMKAMENGVAWFGIPGANSKPGQIGNTVLSGHSSNDIIDQGDYKFIFARLDHLKKGDTIYVNYKGTRYTYTITRKEVVKPTEVGKLVYDTDKPVLTLITCTPLGTSLNRLLVTAEQVSPSPKNAKPAPASTGENTTTEIPGNSPTFLQRVFGGGQG